MCAVTGQGRALSRWGGQGQVSCAHTVLLPPQLGSHCCGPEPSGKHSCLELQGCCWQGLTAGSGLRALEVGALQGGTAAPSQPADPDPVCSLGGAVWHQHGLHFRCVLCRHCLLGCANALETSIL